MIHFADDQAETFWHSHGQQCRPYAQFAQVLMRKLRMLDAATELKDLLAPPGNHLEALRGNRSGQYSIRINSQYRLCFNWTKDGPRNVEVVDYH